MQTASEANQQKSNQIPKILDPKTVVVVDNNGLATVEIVEIPTQPKLLNPVSIAERLLTLAYMFYF